MLRATLRLSSSKPPDRLKNLSERAKRLLSATDLSQLNWREMELRRGALAFGRQLEKVKGGLPLKVRSVAALPETARSGFSRALDQGLKRVAGESAQLGTALREIVDFLALAEQFSAPPTAGPPPESSSSVRAIAGALTDDDFIWAILMLMRYEDVLGPHHAFGSGAPPPPEFLRDGKEMLLFSAASYGVPCLQEILTAQRDHAAAKTPTTATAAGPTPPPDTTATSSSSIDPASLVRKIQNFIAQHQEEDEKEGGAQSPDGERATASADSEEPPSGDRADLHELGQLLQLQGDSMDDVFLAVNWQSSEFHPAYLLVADHARRRLVFSVRGTHSLHDVITDAFAIPMASGNHASVSGLWHAGVDRSARETLAAASDPLYRACIRFPDYQLVFTGHSLGASVAALMALSWNKMMAESSKTSPSRAVGFAPVACTDLNNAMSGVARATVRQFVMGGDIVPRLHVASVMRLRAFSRQLVADIPRMDHRYFYLIQPTLQRAAARQVARLLNCPPELDPRLLSHEAQANAFRYDELPPYFAPLYPPGVIVHLPDDQRAAVLRTDPRFLDSLIVSSSLLSHHTLLAHAQSLLRM